MGTRTTIAGILHGAVSGDYLSFHSAAKIYAKIDAIAARAKSVSGQRARKAIVDHVIKSTSPEVKTCWSSIAFPAELLYAFDIYPLTLEVVAGMFATVGLTNHFLDTADASGVPNTMCSFHRVLLGFSKEKFLKPPSMVGAASILCDGNLKSFSEAAGHQDVPFVFIDIPYEMSDESVHYVREQLQEIICVLEAVSHKRWSEEGFKKIAVRVNEALEWQRRFYGLWKDCRKNLYQCHEVANFTFPMAFLLGSEVLVDVLKARCEDIKSGTKMHRFFDKPEMDPRAKRIMWLHVVPQYDNDIWAIIDGGKRSRVVCDDYSSPYFDRYDLADPLGSIARRLILHPNNGPLERRIEHILRVAKDHRVDGILHYSGWGCHQAAGNVLLIEKAVRDAGYAFLNLNGDPVDSRSIGAGQHRTRLEAFLETIPNK